MASSLRLRRWLAVLAAVLGLLGATVAGTQAAGARSGSVARIYPLGDSITFGTTAVWSNVPGGYRDTLDADLASRGVPHRFVGSSDANPSSRLSADANTAHDGHPGYRIDQVAGSLRGWFRAPLHPDVVLVHLGTNDVLQRFDPEHPMADTADSYADPAVRALFVADLAARLDALVTEVQGLAPKATVVLATIVPMSTGTTADAVPGDVADVVRDLVARRARAGQRVRLADAYAAFAAGGPGLLSLDGVHPSADGYAVLGRVFASALG